MGKLLKNNKNLKNIKTLIVIVLSLVIVNSIMLLTNKSNKNELLAKINNKALMQDEETEYIETTSVTDFEEAWNGNLPINGTMEDDYGIVDSANISIGDDTLPKISDGTEPFDADNEVGNDSNSNNRIVRSFDTITYNVDIKLKVNEEKYTDLVGKKFTGGYLYIEATLNEDNNCEWKTKEMTWINTSNAISKVEGKKLYAVITLNSDEEINSKIIKDLPFVVDSSYTQNKKEVLPTIKVWLKGNSDDEKKSVTGIESVEVTAAESYNVKIKKNEKLWGTRQKLNYDGNEIIGRMFGVGIATTLYNNSDIDKGVKGKEIPTGKIEINTSIKILNEAGEDITSSVNPLIWNYSLNGENGIIENRNMYFIQNSERYRYFPFGRLRNSYKTSSVYNSGTVNMNLNGNILTTTIENYEFNGQFPEATIAQTPLEKKEGYFTSMYLQLVIPETEYKGNYKIIIDEGGNETTKTIKINGVEKNQAKSDDDHIESDINTTIKGDYDHMVILLKDKLYKNTKYLVDGNYNPTHADVTKDQIFVGEFRIQQKNLDVRS